MRVLALVFAAAFAAVSAARADTIVITKDPGGRIGTYVDRLQDIRASGKRVAIDGHCISACTLTLGIIPKERICVTERAVLGFHAAWAPDDNDAREISSAGSRLLWHYYPPWIRKWLAERGGLTAGMKYMGAEDLRRWYSSCK